VPNKTEFRKVARSIPQKEKAALESMAFVVNAID